MFERFTDQARHALVLAQQEARMLQHLNIGTEHLLLGIMQIEDDMPARALRKLDVTLESAQKNVEALQLPTAANVSPHMPFTDSAKKCLELALREALQLGNNYIGTEHLLLGIIRHDSNAVSSVYRVYPATVRQAVIKQMMKEVTQKALETAPPEEPAVRSSAEISAEIETLNERLRELKTELDAAIKRETGCDPSWHH